MGTQRPAASTGPTAQSTKGNLERTAQEHEVVTTASIAPAAG
jgi:hypothetical protein